MRNARLVVEKMLSCDWNGTADFENSALILCADNFELKNNLLGGYYIKTETLHNH